MYNHSTIQNKSTNQSTNQFMTHFQDYHILHIVRTWQILIKFWDGSCPSLKHLAQFGME